jgi:hypothetical protein
MKTVHSSTDIEKQFFPTKVRNFQFVRVVRIISWVVNLLLLVALIWAIYQAVANQNPLPIWAWLGLLALSAVSIGLLVAIIVYRAVSEQVGPFDYRPSSRVAGELRSETQRVEARGANSLHAEIKMMAGVLQLLGGAADVMQADFTYDDADWKQPVVNYAVGAAGQGNLVVKQRATNRPAMRQGRCEWVIRLNQELPIELDVTFGAGKADLKLAGLKLARLRVESGVGELVLDLSGEWEHNLQAFIKAGIGDTLLRLPQNTGVRVQSAVSFGSTHPHGLTWDGEAYTNALYGEIAANLDIIVEGGIGKINLEQTG